MSFWWSVVFGAAIITTIVVLTVLAVAAIICWKVPQPNMGGFIVGVALSCAAILSIVIWLLERTQ